MVDNKLNNTTTEPEITDVQLNFIEKRKFRINGDDSKMLSLNVSDLNTYSRLSEAYPKLQTLLKDAQAQMQNLNTEESLEALDTVATVLTDIDNRMREQIDYIFDTNASEICAPSGNMFDPVNGGFRYEHIIDVLSSLYTTGLQAEFNKMKNRVEKKTSKYTKKYHK